MNRLLSETSRYLRETAALKQWVDACDQVDCYLIGPPDDSLPGISGEYRTANPVTAWLCKGMHCLLPAYSREELQRKLEN